MSTVYFSHSPMRTQVKRNIDFILDEQSYFDGYRRDDIINYDAEYFPYHFKDHRYYADDGSAEAKFSDSGIKRTPSRKRLEGVYPYPGLRVGDLINAQGQKVDVNADVNSIKTIIGISLSDEWSHGCIAYLAKRATVKDFILDHVTHQIAYDAVVDYLNNSLGLDMVKSSPVARV